MQSRNNLITGGRFSKTIIVAIWLGCFLYAHSLLAGNDGPQAFTTEDALNVRIPRTLSLSDDGLYLAVTFRSHSDRLNVDHGRFGDPTYIAPSFSEVFVINTKTGDTKKLLQDKVQMRSFAWSPDSKTLAFLLRKDNEFSLYTYDREKRKVKKIKLKTKKSIASNSPLLWRPDNSGLLLTLRESNWAESSRKMYLDLSEGPIIVQDSREPFLAWDAVRNWNDLGVLTLVDPRSGSVKELLPETRVGNIEQEKSGAFITYIETNPYETAYKRNAGREYEMFMLDMQDNKIKSVRKKSKTRINPRWNSTGDVFAFSNKGDIFLQSVTDTSEKNLTRKYRTQVADDDTTKLKYSLVRWQTDDTALLISSQSGFHLLHTEKDSIELILENKKDDDTSPKLEVVSWSPDSRFLYLSFSTKNKWQRGLVKYDLQTRQMSDLVKDDNLYSNWHFSEDGQRIVYAFSDGDMPNDLYATDPALKEKLRLTDVNPWLDEKSLTRSELIEYLDVDGEKLYGILYYPVNYEPGKKYPLVAEVYETFFNNGFNTRMNLLANAGYFGFRPSVNFQIGFPGEAWLKGVTAGINKLIDRGLVDGDRLGVQGTSYGGYATNLLITQTDRFAAAINISGKVNIISFLGDSPKITTRNYRAAETGQDRLGATLWEQPQKYLAHTAILNADRITTPLLMLTGEGDWNVPATNQREMYYALRRLKKEVVWVHYMNAGHGAGRSGTVEDFHDHWNRVLDWYKEHFDKVNQKHITKK